MLQVQPYPSNPTISGTLVNANDAVTMPALGDQLATVKWIVSTAGTSAISTEISIDGGVNWLASAYSKTLTVSANPTVAPWANNTASAGTFETPIPGNCTHFRVRCATGGTASVVQVQAGAIYCPGTPVTATLYDVTEGSIGAGIAATVQDTSGWTSITVLASSPTTQVVTVTPLDDAGSSISGTSRAFTAASGGIAVFTRYGGDSTAASIAASVIALYPSLTKRMSWSIPAGGTVSTGRIRVEASR